MSVMTPETPAPVETPAPATGAPVETPAELGDAGKAAIDRMKAERDEANRKVRELTPAAQELAALKEAQLTNEQRAAAQAATAERERDEARADGLRYKAAAKHGITEDTDLELLGSGDEAVIAARAERVGNLLKLAVENEQLKAELEALKAGKPAPVSGRPTEALKPGATPEGSKTEDDLTYEALYGTQAS